MTSRVAGWWLLRSKGESKSALAAVPLMRYPRLAGSPTFSTDGNQVAFQLNGEKEDNLDIYVKSMGSEKPLPLTFHPAWYCQVKPISATMT